MAEGRRVFTDATQNSPSGCKKLGKHGSRKGAVRRSAHLITDYKGDEYERVEYTPYGEYWIEKRAPENRTLPFKFTGKERDEETGLYYYGARYLDAKTSRWLTTDPALSDYIPMAPVNDEAKKHNQNLPGMGGIYNSINMHLYHYAGNNPIKYTDPTGNEVAMSAVLGWIGTDTAIPDPTDVIPWKWVGYGIAIAGAFAIDYFAAKAVTNAVAKTKDNSKIEVFHSTNFQPFIDALMSDGNGAIDKSRTDPNSRFGQQFYVASDRETARKEATSYGPLVKFSMSPDANILDLTNPEIAAKMGYSKGISREDTQNLMKNWNLSGIDAIRYPSEKNPGGSNYAIINPTILTLEAVEP